MHSLDPFIERLYKLDPRTAPQWGNMNPQQMTEHLASVIRISNGKKKLTCITPAEKLPRLIAFLESDLSMPPNFQLPGLSALPPLRHSSIAEAADKVKEEVLLFHKHFEQEGVTEVHPVFGELGYELWKRFHHKHFVHHLTQFGLL